MAYDRAVSEQEEKSVATRMFWSDADWGDQRTHRTPPLRRPCQNLLPFFVVSYSLFQARFPFCYPDRHPFYAQSPPLEPSFSSFPSRRLRQPREGGQPCLLGAPRLPKRIIPSDFSDTAPSPLFPEGRLLPRCDAPSGWQRRNNSPA